MAPIFGPVLELAPDDPTFPSQLGDLRDPPACLWVAGRLPSLDRAVVSIVGTRRADPEAVDFTRALSRDLARAGLVVVSGGARGIDAAAHRGALEAGGATVVVLPGGLDAPYPLENRSLFEEVVRTGALVTELPAATPPLRGRFLERNRIVAALGHAVVVVQAPARSGALSTAAHAQRLGRPLFAVPSAPWDPRGLGCLGLLRAGASVCTSARDVLSVPAFGAQLELPALAATDEKSCISRSVDVDGCRVLSLLGARPRHADELARRLALPIERVQRVLLALLLDGLVELRGGGGYVRRPCPGSPK